MGSNQRDASGRSAAGPRTLAAGAAMALAMTLGATPAAAQDLVHRFINPSFGGNPFYSEHLIAVANIHRPSAPTEDTPTDEDLIAQQLRARLLAQLQGNILDSIQNAAVGSSGTFEVGNQTISFTRTATETRITFTNANTGETNTVVLPASSTGTTSVAAEAAAASARVAAASAAQTALQGSAERTLAQGGVVSIGIASGRPANVAATAPRGSAEQSLMASGGSSALPPY